MTPAEYAKCLLDKETSNWDLIFPENKNMKSFVYQSVSNNIAELSRRRKEIFKAADPEYQSYYWDRVRSEFEKIKQLK